MSIKYLNLHSFKEGLILLFQSILETRRITHLRGSAHFTIPLKTFNSKYQNIQVWFADQNSQPLEIEDGINLTLVIK